MMMMMMMMMMLTTYHKENDSQDVDEIEIADKCGSWLVLAPKRAQANCSEAVPDSMDLSPARDGPSQGSSITDQPEQHADENGFAHLLLEGIPPVDLSDQATKENTWRNIPARCRPKIADKLATLSRERPAEANAHVTTATIATFAIKHGSNFITFSKF